MHKITRPKPYTIYLYLISLTGTLIISRGAYELPTWTPMSVFLALLVLATVSQLMTTTIAVSERTGITFEVSTAVSMAALPLFGPYAAAIIITIANLSIWALKDVNKDWKKSWKQLFFNIGMSNIAIFLAGVVFKLLQVRLGINSFLGLTIPWLAAAIVNDQLNIWLLIIIIRLQHDRQMNPVTFWRENRWAMPINVLTISIGGGLLAFAAEHYDWVGITIFFLPIILSAYAFRLYVHQMQAHMDNLENIIAERTKKLEDVMKEKDQFLAVLTHDMKTPLTTAKLYASMIRDYPHAAVEKPHMAEIIVQSQNTLTDMVNNILDIEKLQAGDAMLLEIEKFDIAALIETTVEPLNAQAIAKKIDLQYEIRSRPLLINADRNQIKRVLQNLVSNALKYTPEAGCVRVHAQMKEQTIIIEVNDNGYGISAADLPFVFDRYRRVAKHKSLAAGTGLGLTITKVIVEAHGGSISVTSEENIGSTFTVKLPYKGSFTNNL